MLNIDSVVTHWTAAEKPSSVVGKRNEGTLNPEEPVSVFVGVFPPLQTFPRIISEGITI